jgi:hypothetical protein
MHGVNSVKFDMEISFNNYRFLASKNTFFPKRDPQKYCANYSERLITVAAYAAGNAI